MGVIWEAKGHPITPWTPLDPPGPPWTPHLPWGAWGGVNLHFSCLVSFFAILRRVFAILGRVFVLYRTPTFGNEHASHFSRSVKHCVVVRKEENNLHASRLWNCLKAGDLCSWCLFTWAFEIPTHLRIVSQVVCGRSLVKFYIERHGKAWETKTF